MPFLGQDWRSPGWSWIKTEDGWKRCEPWSEGLEGENDRCGASHGTWVAAQQSHTVPAWLLRLHLLEPMTYCLAESPPPHLHKAGVRKQVTSQSLSLVDRLVPMHRCCRLLFNLRRLTLTVVREIGIILINLPLQLRNLKELKGVVLAACVRGPWWPWLARDRSIVFSVRGLSWWGGL